MAPVDAAHASLDVPDWLTGSTPTNSTAPTTPTRQKPLDPGVAACIRPEEYKRLRQEVREMTFDLVFNTIMERVASGYTMTAALNEDHREFDPGAFMRWVKKDPAKMLAYKEAKEIRTEVWAGKMIQHMIAEDSTEDVQRSKLIVDGYKWLMAADNRRTYGASQQIEVNQNISITAALEEAMGRVIDITPRMDALTGDGVGSEESE